MKKPSLFQFIVVIGMIMPHRMNAQNFFFDTYGGSTNLWSNTYMQLPTNLINELVSMAIDEDNEANAAGAGFRFEMFKLRNDGNKVKLKNGKYWGFKKRDMFRNFQYGLRLGWQPRLSPFGIYISCAFQHRQFKVLFDSSADVWSHYKLNYIRPGIGIRVTIPVRLRRWKPIMEIGSAYNYNFKCKAPGVDPKKQFNNGITTSFAAGVRKMSRKRGLSISAGAELDNYNLFNKKYTPDGGITYPYANLTSKHTTIFLSIAQDF